MKNQATTNAREFAKSLRRAMTAGERLLWSRLRGEQLGVKFRRQHPLGAYVADFACLAPPLVVEVDGSQHAGQAGYDARRDAFFRNAGFAVMRFPANLPFVDLQSMVEAIYQRVMALSALAPIPAFPQRGKEPENAPQPQRDTVPALPLPLWGKEPENALQPQRDTVPALPLPLWGKEPENAPQPQRDTVPALPLWGKAGMGASPHPDCPYPISTPLLESIAQNTPVRLF